MKLIQTHNTDTSRQWFNRWSNIIMEGLEPQRKWKKKDLYSQKIFTFAPAFKLLQSANATLTIKPILNFFWINIHHLSQCFYFCVTDKRIFLKPFPQYFQLSMTEVFVATTSSKILESCCLKIKVVSASDTLASLYTCNAFNNKQNLLSEIQLKFMYVEL